MGFFKRNITKRNISFFNSDMPLLSKRAKIILENPKDARKLAIAIRESQDEKNESKKDTGSFTVSEEIQSKLEKEYK